MLLLMLFAFIAGAGTAITPCVLPVVPALLASSATGGRRRPIGIVLGLAATFTIAIVLLAQLVKGVGLASGAARTLAIVVLFVFGLAMLIPDVAARVQAPLSRLARFGPKTRGDGFWSGIGVGAALGFVCAPCAGPILAAVTSVSASSGASAQVVLVALSYSAGLAAVMLVYAFAGRAVIDRIRKVGRGYAIERTLGIVLIVTAVANREAGRSEASRFWTAAEFSSERVGSTRTAGRLVSLASASSKRTSRFNDIATAVTIRTIPSVRSIA